MSKIFFSMAILSTVFCFSEGKAYTEEKTTVSIRCTLNGASIGHLINVPSSPNDEDYTQACNTNFPSAIAPNNSCESGCAAIIVSSVADFKGPMRAIPAPLSEGNVQTLSSPTAPTEEGQTQYYAPSQGGTQNFSRSEGEGPQVPADPTGNLRLPSMTQDALQE